MSKYYSINEFSKILGVSAQTLRNWDKNGKLHPHHTSSNGYRYYSHEQLNQVMNPRIKYDGLNWWITVGIEYENSTSLPLNEGIGIDLGIKELA